MSQKPDSVENLSERTLAHHAGVRTARSEAMSLTAAERRQRYRERHPERDRQQRLDSARKWRASPRGKAWYRKRQEWLKTPAGRAYRRAYDRKYYQELKADPVRWKKRNTNGWRTKNRERYLQWHQHWRHEEPKGIAYRIRHNFGLSAFAPDSFVESIVLLGQLRKEMRQREYK